MRFLKKIFIIVFIVLANTISCAQANWPMLLVPSISFLSANNFIDTTHCPSGQGRIRRGTMITMKALCITYCPHEWYWEAVWSDESCHDLKNGYIPRDVTILYHPDEDGDEGQVQYSEVNAYYGESDTNTNHTIFKFTTTKEHWYCSKMGAGSDTLICANDI